MGASRARLMTAIVTALLAVATIGAAAPAAAGHHGSWTGAISFWDRQQRIDGFGFSQAFQRAAVINGLFGLPPERGQEVVDLLFDQRIGAGASILRLGIGSSSDDVYDHMRSIQPEDPGGPDAPPRYVWDGYDGGQVWLAREAAERGVRRFYADAWSAPGYMKTNGSDSNGGTLCGVPGATCASGDWRQAYANYLVQYLRFYAQEGIRITDLGFTNEPDLTTSYASMRFTPEQVVDFIHVLGPTLARSGLRTNLVCCDVAGWNEQIPYTEAIEADRLADAYVGIHSGHSYVSPADRPLPTDATVWMSEWGPGGNVWDEGWDSGLPSAGITVAEDIHRTLTDANANAYLFWLGASIGATRALIQIDGENYHTSARLWAFAAYSRFIRPGAYRVTATAADEELRVSAYRNLDGSRVIEIINVGRAATDADFRIDATSNRYRVNTYLTDDTHSLERTDTASIRGDRLSVELPPRSLTTIVLTARGA